MIHSKKSRNLDFISKVNTKSRGESEEASPIPFDLNLKSRSITRVWKSFFELYPKEFQILLLSIGISLIQFYQEYVAFVASF